MAVAPVELKDRLGRIIVANDVVAVAKSNELRVCTVIKVIKKMIKVKPINNPSRFSEFNVFPDRAVIIDSSDSLTYFLKGGKG